MLVVLLLVFDDPEPALERVRDQYINMLRYQGNCAVTGSLKQVGLTSNHPHLATNRSLDLVQALGNV